MLSVYSLIHSSNRINYLGNNSLGAKILAVIDNQVVNIHEKPPMLVRNILFEIF